MHVARPIAHIALHQLQKYDNLYTLCQTCHGTGYQPLYRTRCRWCRLSEWDPPQYLGQRCAACGGQRTATSELVVDIRHRSVNHVINIISPASSVTAPLSEVVGHLQGQRLGDGMEDVAIEMCDLLAFEGLTPSTAAIIMRQIMVKQGANSGRLRWQRMELALIPIYAVKYLLSSADGEQLAFFANDQIARIYNSP